MLAGKWYEPLKGENVCKDLRCVPNSWAHLFIVDGKVQDGSGAAVSLENGRFRMMNPHPTDGVSLPSLEAIELELEIEGREWTRRRLQERLQQLADTHGGVFPPGRTPPAKTRTPPAHPARTLRRD